MRFAVSAVRPAGIDSEGPRLPGLVAAVGRLGAYSVPCASLPQAVRHRRRRSTHGETSWPTIDSARGGAPTALRTNYGRSAHVPRRYGAMGPPPAALRAPLASTAEPLASLEPRDPSRGHPRAPGDDEAQLTFREYIEAVVYAASRVRYPLLLALLGIVGDLAVPPFFNFWPHHGIVAGIVATLTVAVLTGVTVDEILRIRNQVRWGPLTVSAAFELLGPVLQPVKAATDELRRSAAMSADRELGSTMDLLGLKTAISNSSPDRINDALAKWAPLLMNVPENAKFIVLAIQARKSLERILDHRMLEELLEDFISPHASTVNAGLDPDGALLDAAKVALAAANDATDEFIQRHQHLARELERRHEPPADPFGRWLLNTLRDAAKNQGRGQPERLTFTDSRDIRR